MIIRWILFITIHNKFSHLVTAGGEFGCVVSILSGNSYYVGLYNFDSIVDGAATRRYTCLVIYAIYSNFCTENISYITFKQYLSLFHFQFVVLVIINF